jgi:hypothetical protein
MRKILNHSKRQQIHRTLNYIHAQLHNCCYWLVVKIHQNFPLKKLLRDASRWQVLSGMEVSCVVVGEMCGYVDGLCKVTSKGGM